MHKTPPVALLRVSGFALLANFAAILAQSSVESTQNKRLAASGAPPMAKWLADRFLREVMDNIDDSRLIYPED